MQRLQSRALVLRAIDYGEADRVVTLLTHERGKLSALARGARRSQRRFGAALSLLGTGEMVLSGRPGAEMWTLERIESPDLAIGLDLLGDMARLAHAGYVAELVREVLPAEQPEPEIYALLVAFLAALNAGPARVERLRAFELGLLERIGLKLELARCVVCGGPPSDSEGQLLDGPRGGVVCAGCGGRGAALDGSARAELLALERAGLAGSETFSMSEVASGALREATLALILDHFGRRLRSVEFIDKLNHAGERGP